MFKILNKVQFKPEANRMRSVASTDVAIDIFNSTKSKNLKFLLKQRFDWMNNFISENDTGLEVGSGAGFTRFYIKNKNFKMSDLSEDPHLDFKNIDAQATGFDDNSFNYVIASNMIHHIPYPVKFFKEMNRILKKNGKLIIFESYCSLIFQLTTILMRHEGYDFTLDVWDQKKPKRDETDAWAGNIAVPHLIFDDKKKFDDKLGKLFSLKYEKLTECFIFLNSGGVTSKTFYIPLLKIFLKGLNLVDKFLIRFFPNIFCMGRRIVLEKKDL
ncbi:class I SAM-dependent methyltransferase [Pelagibacteraceae bacterium]|nr:class I SAM-dependent methyltransferase [Pelagibacteraceae bacterium]